MGLKRSQNERDFSWTPQKRKTVDSALPVFQQSGVSSTEGPLASQRASQVLVVKSPPASAGDVKDAGSTPGPGRSSGGRHGNPLQYSCLENPMDRGAWGVCGVTEADTTQVT